LNLIGKQGVADGYKVQANSILTPDLQMTSHNAITPSALRLPGITKLSKKRVILASNSPRRRDILKTFVLDTPIPLDL
jgi:hypothetical protein